MPPVLELGRGGFGEVVQSIYHGLPVAVKRFFPDKCTLEMVQREVETCRLIGRHPHMVYLVHAEVADDVRHARLLFQLCQGTLDKMFMTSGKSMDAALVRQFVPQFYSMLAYLNHLSVVHLDIKPKNILVSSGHHLKLADFGSAVQLAKPPPAKFRYASTTAYMAPECTRAGGRIVTPAADMWAIGVILHMMVSGRLPEFGEALALAPLPADTHDELRRLITRMLQVTFTERLHVMELGMSAWSKPPLELHTTVNGELFDAMNVEHNSRMPHRGLSMYRHPDPAACQAPPLVLERLDSTYCSMDDHLETAQCFHAFMLRMHAHVIPDVADDGETADALLQLWLAFASARTLMLQCNVPLRQAVGMFMLRVAQPVLYHLCPSLDGMTACSAEFFNRVRNVVGLLSFFGQCAQEWSANKRPLPAMHPALYLVKYCNAAFEFAKTRPDAERVRSWPGELSILLLHWNPVLKHCLKGH
jgi:serine/threonine protein kinase